MDVDVATEVAVVHPQYDLAKADVVAATTSGTAEFNKNQFDVAVVDEATQVSRPATAIVIIVLVPISLGRLREFFG